MQRTASFFKKFLCWQAVIWAGLMGPTHAETVTVFAASSLRDVVREMAADFEGQSGNDVTLVFAASSTVARQVARGAPADLVLLADQEWGDWLIQQGAAVEVQPFASNRLVLVAKGEMSIQAPSEIVPMLGGGLIALAQTDAVPAGRYGKAALETLGLWQTLEPQIVQASNVRAALRFVERGEVELGIGYASDVAAFSELEVIYEFPANSHPEVIYVGAALTPQGAELMDHLQGDRGQEALASWGFLPWGDNDD